MEKLFYKGYIVRKEYEVSPGLILVTILQDFNINKDQYDYKGTQWVVDITKLEPLIQTKFQLGDHVQRIQGTMIGKVSGYELFSNSVVVISDRIAKYGNDKTRYVYKHNELEKHDPNKFTFELGQRYLLNGKTKVTCVMSCYNEGRIMLYDNDGRIVLMDVPAETTSDKLLTYNIERIKKI